MRKKFGYDPDAARIYSEQVAKEDAKQAAAMEDAIAAARLKQAMDQKIQEGTMEKVEFRKKVGLLAMEAAFTGFQISSMGITGDITLKSPVVKEAKGSMVRTEVTWVRSGKYHVFCVDAIARLCHETVISTGLGRCGGLAKSSI